MPMSSTGTAKKQGFTLIELAIVIVIMALIIAGVMVGRSLVETASLQSVVSDFDLYRSAALSYRNKYAALPGDMSTATALTSADGNCPNPTASNAHTTATCNGDGNGFIGDNTGDPLGAFTTYNEPLLVWQHLTNEGLIPGKFNGRRSTASNKITIGVNVPESKVDAASFILRYFPTNTVTAGYFKTTYNHVFFFGKPSTDADLPFIEPALTIEQAKSIDQKIDDGMPGLGKVLTLPGIGCSSDDNETAGIYENTSSDLLCPLIFITEF